MKKKLNFKKIEISVSKMYKSTMSITQNDDKQNSLNTKHINSLLINGLKINYDTLYNTMTKMKMPEKPFTCSCCGKGSYISTCAKCLLPDAFVETQIKALDIGIKSDNHEERKEMIKKINDNNNRMKIEDILKIKLRKNKKLPINSWTDKNNQSKTFKSTNDNNVGIVCNETSGVFAVDLDFYSKDGKDPYDPINNPNHKLFIDKFGTNYIEHFDTFTQTTPNGGVHLLFRHEEGLVQAQNDKYKIDTRGGDTNGYIVGFGSKVNGKTYSVKLNRDIKPLPDDLKAFLKEYVFDDKETKITISKKNKKDKIKLKSGKSHTISNEYAYNLTEDELTTIIEKIPRNYFTDFTKWLIFTSGMKQIKRKDLWCKYSKLFGSNSYDEKQNEYYWNKTKNKDEECMYFECLLKQANCLDFISLSKYKPLPERKTKHDIEIDMPYLTGKKIANGYKNGFKYEKHKHIVLQSDTGTAKSSSFLEYVKKSGEKFINIVSRISLALDQYEDYNSDENEEHFKGVDYYKYGLDNTNQGAILCIDSIMKLRSWTWGEDCEISERVVFLDEFNSLIEYCLDTTTMDNKRMEVFDFLVNEIFMKAKKIVCADADISDISMNFIKYINQKRNGFVYIKNNHIHNKDTPATEIYSKGHLVNKLAKEKTFFLCCDSKREAIDIYQTLIKKNPKKKIKLVVARDDIRKDSEEHIDLKNEPCVIYSPKITYGNDSNGYLGKHKRPVYCYYTGMTISPTAMFQQINRERKIKHLYYCFENKEFSKCAYKTTDDILKEFKQKHKTSCELIGRGHYTEYIEEMFIDLYHQLMIKKDTYDTNKFVHFKKLLPNRGFVDTCIIKKQTEKQDSKAILIKKMRVNKFNSENFNVGEALNSQLNIDVLRIQNTDLLRKNKALFCESGKAEKHIMSSAFYMKKDSYASKMLFNEDDIEFKKLSKDNKYANIVYLQQVYETLGYTPQLEKKDEVKQITEDEMIGNYKKYCRGKISELDLSDEQKKKAFLFKTTKSILGDGWISNKQVRDKETKKRYVEYAFNKSKLNNLKKILDSRKPTKVINPTSKDYTEYHKKWNNRVYKKWKSPDFEKGKLYCDALFEKFCQ